MRNLTPDESHYVLQSLISAGAVRSNQIEKVLRGRNDEIRSLRERLASLERLSSTRGAAGRRRGRPSRGPGRPASPARRRMSPKTRALRRLQGKYMGLVRGLKPAEKARIRSVREKQGMGAALKLAASLAAKR